MTSYCNYNQEPQNQGAERASAEGRRPEGDCRLAVWFRVGADMRFLSHRDSMDLWHKALVRAQLPLRYSCGFNPHPRITLPLPRNVGMAADEDLLLVQLNSAVCPEEAVARLKRQLPEGIAISSASYVGAETAVYPVWARYRLDLREPFDQVALRKRIAEFESAAEWLVDRAAHGRHGGRVVDLRHSLSELDMNDAALWCTVAVGPGPTARIDELCAMLGIEQSGQVRYVCRVATGYSAAPPGKSVTTDRRNVAQAPLEKDCETNNKPAARFNDCVPQWKGQMCPEK